MRELFIYYRVAAARLSSASAGVHALQAALCERHPGLHARVLCRPGATDDVQTWMETYACMPGGITPALEAALNAALGGCEPWWEGSRHVEVFNARPPP